MTGSQVSYQEPSSPHYWIIASKPSEGLSLLFLLLGSTSSAAAMWDMSVFVLCSWGRCIEVTAGAFKSIQWFCFTLICILHTKFYPEHRKYVQFELEAPNDARIFPTQIKTPVKSFEWRSSLLYAWITLGHFAITTLYLILTAVPMLAPDVPLPASAQTWATFLSVTSVILAAIQYAPQLVHTYTHKVVGLLSIPMCMQSPGALLMILGFALRPDTNWTSSLTFLAAGVVQATLLVICIAWIFRPCQLRIDDFGNPVMLVNG
ncbi:hypothetical protein AGABI2DRAFT_186661 [Agaricus bisporus var. bisporus H97]|uniref:hypothetical protein n=1 Tax=Agaricus bisporus var. bisporus (strain H97 / ATCC MYA-4626 / FGSC 10389) TaxID=936046 RepID=UPI00029F7FC2|nr:hypothetical protein AGABI2DRAFT_186661 [Agaricus bisporus var. bisporus H97]EKV45980.1 hypothetical protein AGABI2DRAFT_186661 [Agaricus bisporus var. bisporus H97]